MKKILYTISIIFLFSTICVFAGERIPSLLVSNSWILVETNKGKPHNLLIKEFKATFLSDGKWFFKSTMTGKYEGMNFKGSGTWRVEGETLIFTAGNKSGKSLVEIKDGILKLNPDPVVMFNGSEPVITMYSKDK